MAPFLPAGSKERRTVLPSMATTPAMVPLEACIQAMKQVWKACASRRVEESVRAPSGDLGCRAAFRSVWLDTAIVKVERSEAAKPEIVCISAANAHHEAIEAMRWARQLVASGNAKPEEIAIAAAIPSDYDDAFFSLRADANLDLHFVHGVKVTTTRDGQAAAALADILLRGASEAEFEDFRRLRAGSEGSLMSPGRLAQGSPLDAPLTSAVGWDLFLAALPADAWPDGKDHASDLRAILCLVGAGPAGAVEALERSSSAHGRSKSGARRC